MKTIRITYRHSDVEPSLQIILFFRMIGIYVIERFSHPQFDFRKEFSAIEAKRIGPEWDPCDADIFLISSEEDYYDYKYDMENALVVIDNNVHLPQAQFLNCVTYSRGQNEKLIFGVIDQLHQMRIIGAAEAGELKRLEEILEEKQYFPLVLQCNALTSKIRNEQAIDLEEIKQNIRSWREIIDTLLSALMEFGIQRWGESRGERIQFSIANASYELDLYCKRMKEDLEITTDSLIAVCQYMDNFQDDSLQIALMILKAQIYMDLMGDVPKGYDYLLGVCDRCGDYNAYAYFLKGNYWLNNAKDYENAVKYYRAALERFPEYYRAWYRLGVAYYKLGKKRKALMAFEAVTKILKPRLIENNLRVREVEHLFLSYKYCGRIYFEKKNDLREAISCYKYAQRVYESIDISTFYTSAGIEDAAVENIRKNTKNMLAIDEVRERLQHWQRLAVLTLGETV